ncbi:GNAT family N-acetyltransferase [Mesobacillus maritimus]|uniref:GNAT family N-acetyltransferase n=1 Tax=Mesobacillus maritimus TaxID=1643336 RepID=UPI0020421253|nr:GNAT family N-acetyltransferase [Mesobacillus maritimus]MCM3586729.1 GNAT family N-acetyltransferase [Mesobacillus maritimus]MCM3668516.1 GNAT family N-acetyltransferase [Mesobacillus maritimus]
MQELSEITYKVNEMITAEQISILFEKSGIRRPIEDLPRLQRMLENGDLLITAWEKNKLVGVARAITDFSYCCYLSDLAVDQAYQKRGIGKKLVRLLQSKLTNEVTLLLLSSPIAMDYYPRIGFEKIDNGFRILREK